MQVNRKQGRLRLVLALFVLLLLTVFYKWQAPGSRLTDEQISSYLERTETGLPMPRAEKAEFLARLRSWAEADDGRPVHMLNLISFHEQMQPVPGHPEFEGTAEEANAHYEKTVLPLLASRGIYPIFASAPQGLGQGSGARTNLLGYETALEGWDRILVVRYPSRRAFLDLVSDPSYLTVVPYKLAAIDLGFVPLDMQYKFPDLLWLATLLAAGALLVIARPLWSRER